MPQMAPLLWLNLYIFFIIIFMLIMIVVFFSKLPIKINTPSAQKIAPPKTWKW
uniref:ATP synthase F0 subunit 8 n=1 Tax=Palaemon sinensis TaxID=349473 RepID=A0A5J6DVP4_9EUCA|nr:ATP synthase F0 subunit 8 [Palaemon sinensis]QES95225.1 ATP synthase F0 subunit 8 [Palaemon sinensis]QQY98742.1 ATP synthase F0 subunit 8 [Palaemon sinensis]